MNLENLIAFIELEFDCQLQPHVSSQKIVIYLASCSHLIAPH